jgi:hypothetical protein
MRTSRGGCGARGAPPPRRRPPRAAERPRGAGVSARLCTVASARVRSAAVCCCCCKRLRAAACSCCARAHARRCLSRRLCDYITSHLALRERACTHAALRLHSAHSQSTFFVPTDRPGLSCHAMGPQTGASRNWHAARELPDTRWYATEPGRYWRWSVSAAPSSYLSVLASYQRYRGHTSTTLAGSGTDRHALATRAKAPATFV